MTAPQITLTVLLLAALGLFIWGKWRQDLVAWLALMAAALAGLVAPDQVWLGLAHPAVVSVGAVLVLSGAMANSGVVDWAVRPLGRAAKRPMLLMIALTATVAAVSAFINNVGALALLMPVAIRLARDSGRPASVYLMPLAFASLLGGMTTLIGTPPNLIVAGFRERTGHPPFAMFDFALVGVPVAVAGVVYLVALGWRLVPRRPTRVGSEELVQLAPYLTEATVTAKSTIVGVPTGRAIPKDVQLLSVVRGEDRRPSPSRFFTLREGDVLVMMGSAEAIEAFAKETLLSVAHPAPAEEPADPAGRAPSAVIRDAAALVQSKDIGLAEAVVSPTSRLIGGSAASLHLRDRSGVNLLALAREGSRRETRLASARFRAGDVLLLQGLRDELPAIIADLGCLPLAERSLTIGQKSARWRAVAIFGAAIIAVGAGWVPMSVAFVTAAVIMVIARAMTIRQAYEAIDWPILALLAAMIPLGTAIETTGLASHVANAALWAGTFAPPWAIVAILLVATMFLSDLVNNAAAAVMMCPIALGVAHGLGASPDPFLIAVAIGASCAFLTPVGHQSNLLVMGPGGYRFGDYWRCGIILEAIITLVAVPAIMLAWPPF